MSLGLEKPNYADEMQRPRCYYPGIKARPVHDPSDFPWTADFVRSFSEVKRELLDLTSAMDLARHPGSLADRGRWDRVDFFIGGSPSQSACRACPRTVPLLNTVAGIGKAGNAYVSVLQPDTHIKRHFGSTNTRIRCHLGLIVPDGARIRVGQKMCQWREGQFLIFDDAYEHEVWNDSDSERIVLLFDTWHPELNAAERWAIHAARHLRWGLRDFGPVQKGQLGVGKM